MKKFITLISLVLMFIFVGCANDGALRYDGRDYNQIKQVLIGDIIEIRNVVVKGNESGTVLGAVLGGVLGTTMGGGDGKTLAAVGGAVAGGVLGKQLSESAAQELTLSLVDGRMIVVISKGTALNVGDRVRVIKDGNKVASVKRVEQ